ncbi:SDR family NAD(P)-dependent oxidoreductase [Halobellus rufus]|uniref:SDR family NAD(P)-dependent oxidoreductase n=1 Tax=Halobellus rufus TaxID=1448860 RepID=UPI0006791C0E|nr:SDR family oxidoreductase [Halobellus rufus]
MSLLDGKTAVVTGGSSGIGRAIARGFAEQGAEAVVVADVREQPKEGGPPTHELIETETDTSSVFVECDVTDRSDLREAVDAAEAAGGLDVLVNNAGIWRSEEFFEVTEAEFQRMLDINLKGAYFGSQIAAERLVEGDSGAIINVSSIAGLFGNGDWPTYAASKGGLTTLTYSLAHKLGGHGIRVNAIHPGGVQTMIGGEPSDPEAAAEQAEQFTQMVPLGRYGQPEDIAGAATFLASDLASYVTGESLVVDGGWTSWR